MAIGRFDDYCDIHRMLRTDGVCPRCVDEAALRIARSKLPNHLGRKFGDTVDIEVTSVETGVSLPTDECMGVEKFKFVLSEGGWELYPTKELPKKVKRDTKELNVVKMSPSENLSGENVVQRLQEALELAREGKIDNLALVAIGNDGCNYDCWANGSRPFEMMGALESLKFDFFNKQTDRR